MLQETFDRVNKAIGDFRFPISGWEGGDFLNEDYHKWLAHYIKIYKPKKCLELGRRRGNSLYSMSYFLPETSELVSYDLNMLGNVVNKPNVQVRSYGGDFTQIPVWEYDFIFVDINGRGALELQLHHFLKDNAFYGIAAWDDVGTQWCPDSGFWDRLPENTNKLKVNLHGNAFGLIYYG